MKQLVMVALLCCFQLAPLCAQATADILRSETARFEATVQQDTASLRQLLDEDLLYIHSNGLEESASGFIASVASGKIVYQSITPIRPVQVLKKGKVALADGIVDVKGLYNGTPYGLVLRYTSVYRKSKGRWRLLRWQSLKIEH